MTREHVPATSRAHPMRRVGVAAVGASVAIAGVFGSISATATAADPQSSTQVSVHEQAAPPLPPATTKACLKRTGFRCYSPPQLLNGYGIDKLHKSRIDGRGTKIAILMSPSATLQKDLNYAAKTWKLPSTKIKIVKPFGQLPSDPEGEGGMDTQAAHFVAPRAQLLYVEIPAAMAHATVLTDQQLATAIKAAVKAGADVISMSFGWQDINYPKSDAAIANATRKGIVIVAASGDSGVAFNSATTRQTSYPASNPNVTTIGGTLLTLNGRGKRLIPDIGWGPSHGGNVSGGGVSTMFAQPSWQKGVPGTSRAGRSYPDLSMSASSDGAMLVSISYQGNSYIEAGGSGTSLAAPLFAGVAALSVQVAGKGLPYANRALYAMARNRSANGIADVVQGNNSYGNVAGYPATTGFDMMTGVGTIGDATTFVPTFANKASTLKPGQVRRLAVKGSPRSAKRVVTWKRPNTGGRATSYRVVIRRGGPRAHDSRELAKTTSRGSVTVKRTSLTRGRHTVTVRAINRSGRGANRGVHYGSCHQRTPLMPIMCEWAH